MEARYFPTVQQDPTHLHGLMDPVVPDGSIVVFDGLDDSGDLFWYLEL